LPFEIPDEVFLAGFPNIRRNKMTAKTIAQLTYVPQSIWEDISYQYIQETLSIYKAEYVYLTSAKWNGSELAGSIRLEHYPFTKENHIDYVTASMLMLYLSQLGFIYARLLCERDLMPSGIKITTQEFFCLLNEGNIVFTGLDKVKLRRKIFITEPELQIRMSLDRVLCVRGCPIGDLLFDVADGAFSGKIRVMIIRD